MLNSVQGVVKAFVSKHKFIKELWGKTKTNHVDSNLYSDDNMTK